MLSHIEGEKRQGAPSDGSGARTQVAERILKTLLSMAVVGLFVAAGALVAAVKPFHLAGLLLGHPHHAGASRTGTAADAPEVPVPPDTQLTYSTATTAGLHCRYESQLSPEGLVLFYAGEMPRCGWSREAGLQWEAASPQAPLTVLSFKAARARCIIGLEESDPFSTVINVLVMGPAQQEGAGP